LQREYPGVLEKLEDEYSIYMRTATKQAGLVFTSRILGYALGFSLQTVLARFSEQTNMGFTPSVSPSQMWELCSRSLI